MPNQDPQVMGPGQQQQSGYGADVTPGQQDGQYNDEDSAENGVGKGKRRSKNDVEGRDFKCNYCVKTYLSYPALYTHIKQKHSKGPDGETRAPPTSGRGRGRPRKNVSRQKGTKINLLVFDYFACCSALPQDRPAERRLLPTGRQEGWPD